MQKDFISFRETGYFSDLICDYIEQKEWLKPFYHRYPNLENFALQIEDKQKSYNHKFRSILAERIGIQYDGIEISELTASNISLLKNNNCYTITTGHQLNLFTGPVYFLYKIVSTINLTKSLKEAYPGYDFIPVYWMATEDHDFEEINYFNFKGSKIKWESLQKGPVGRFSTDGLEDVHNIIDKEFGDSDKSKRLKHLFKKAYLEHNSLAKATRFLVNDLFGDFGLVIVDGDDVEFKRQLVPHIKNDIFIGTTKNRSQVP